MFNIITAEHEPHPNSDTTNGLESSPSIGSKPSNFIDPFGWCVPALSGSWSLFENLYSLEVFVFASYMDCPLPLKLLRNFGDIGPSTN